MFRDRPVRADGGRRAAGGRARLLRWPLAELAGCEHAARRGQARFFSFFFFSFPPSVCLGVLPLIACGPQRSWRYTHCPFPAPSPREGGSLQALRSAE